MNYEAIRASCDEQSRISEEVIDQFLLDFMAPKAGMTKLLRTASARYKHVIKEMPESFFPRLSAQYIIGRTMMKGGLLERYLNHPLMQRLGH